MKSLENVNPDQTVFTYSDLKDAFEQGRRVQARDMLRTCFSTPIPSRENLDDVDSYDAYGRGYEAGIRFQMQLQLDKILSEGT